jgi:hypothetical protein
MYALYEISIWTILVLERSWRVAASGDFSAT